ncbi:peptidylprolyl isomerase [Panacibacter sp. DH6]|uniref:Peptidylprolyl isomerase n=1 Tax=Panacibacter microcysteis TaxID=2793269 RepID=A0A931GV29_9BACT|nr:peptidylprolyl isomerase [Panacibacter microcysteis]MBG9375985.1 peptidylprolyl isomerase [Panacibacter microcysteis]
MRIHKLPLLLLTALAVSAAGYSQTLFTYGAKTVSKDEFIKAFNKNPDTTGDRSEKLKQYLDLYVNFKLKLQAATDEKLSNDPAYKAEADNFRTQLTENYINEQADINGLVKEAFLRSQKDILLAHVFVEVKPEGDTLPGYNRISEAYNALKAGKDFSAVSAEYSSNAAVDPAKGVIGYVTVFTLPYAIENLVYSLPPNTYSNIYRSKAGFHIFKNLGERPAVGKRKVQQILLAVPASFTPEEKAKITALKDSVYHLLKSGASFDKMVQEFSAPNNNYDPSNIIEVGVGQYSQDFEDKVFALKNVGDISEPFENEYGYNIIKLLETMPVNKDESDVMARARLQERVEQDNRLSIARDALIEKWKKQIKYTPATYNAKDLAAYIDSSLKKGRALTAFKGITPNTILFSFAKERISADKWFQYNKDIREMAPYDQHNPDVLMNQFVKTSADKYYRAHIEEFHPPVAAQLKEFNEANLLFSVMDKHVWSRAAEDSVGLKNYYNQHKDQYKWQPGVSAVIFSSSSKEVIDGIAGAMARNAKDWRAIAEPYSEMATADSSRFEDGQLPLKQPVPMQKGYLSKPEQNETGDTYTLVYVFDVFKDPGQRSFDEARGMVINDYQQVLEQKWITELKKKYPVKMNDAIVNTL